MLRRQMIRKLRIPLVVMSPKSMLRKKESFSSLEDLANGSFQELIPEVEQVHPRKIRRVALCSGKVYYEMIKRRKEAGVDHTAIIRIEQLFPFPVEALSQELAKYPKAEEICWTQEEPRNQGAWYQIQHHLRAACNDKLRITYAGRVPCSAPAGGSLSLHNRRERMLINDSLALPHFEEPPKAPSPSPAPKA